ncbi:MAG: hypothetical protein ABIP95_12365 [Pelobium sp.]
MIDDLNTFSKNRKLIHDIEENLSDLITEFQNIKNLRDLSVNDERFNVAIKSFYNLFSFVPILMTYLNPSDKYIFRARSNDEKNILYTRKDEISYNQNFDKIKAGRFNQPKQSVFYGTLPTEDSSITPYAAACFETCKGLIDYENPVNLKDFTIGRWIIKQPMYVANFCFDSVHLKGNKSMKEATEKFIAEIVNSLNKESSDFIIDFYTYLSEMSGKACLNKKEKNEYYILTALFYSVQYYYKNNMQKMVYGLVYPGAGTEAKGLNIVLTSDAIDDFLELDLVVMYRFIRSGDTFSVYPCSKVGKYKEGKYLLSNFIRIPENKYYTVECESEDCNPLKEIR